MSSMIIRSIVLIFIASFFFAAGAESVFAIAGPTNAPSKVSYPYTAEAKAPGQTEVFGTNVCISWTRIGRCKKKKVNICAPNYGQWCFVENACGSATEGTYDCAGRCDAVPRPIPDGWSPPCNPPSCSYSGTLTWAPGCSGYFSGTVTDDRWYYTDNTASGYSGRFAWWCRNGTWTQTGYGGDVRTWCNADAVPPPPPICSPLNGNACTSAPNNCGVTAPGTINCSGACSAVTPPDSSCPPPPPPCFPDCSQANQVCAGKTFTDANNCGTNNCTGTRSCDYNWKEVAP